MDIALGDQPVSMPMLEDLKFKEEIWTENSEKRKIKERLQ